MEKILCNLEGHATILDDDWRVSDQCGAIGFRTSVLMFVLSKSSKALSLLGGVFSESGMLFCMTFVFLFVAYSSNQSVFIYFTW